MLTLHVRCGSDIREALKAGGIGGDFLEWSDPLCRGPVPPGLDRPALIEKRAAWLSGFSGDPETIFLQDLTQADQKLTSLSSYGEVVLWFEHDLYDQICLIALLSQISPRDGLFIVSINQHPNHSRFIGFGQLAPEELTPLLETKAPVTAAMFETARFGYEAFRLGDLDALKKFAAAPETSKALPFLPAALKRHILELPDQATGLSLTEKLTLDALQEGAETAGQCFRTLMMETDPQPFLGDLLYWEDILRLAKSEQPAISPIPKDWRDPIALTEFGRAILDGTACWSEANSVSRWWGGRHIVGG